MILPFKMVSAERDTTVQRRWDGMNKCRGVLRNLTEINILIITER